MFIPRNLTLQFLPECDGCDLFEENIDTYETGYNENRITITCQHMLACKRTAMHCSENAKKDDKDE